MPYNPIVMIINLRFSSDFRHPAATWLGNRFFPISFYTALYLAISFSQSSIYIILYNAPLIPPFGHKTIVSALDLHCDVHAARIRILYTARILYILRNIGNSTSKKRTHYSPVKNVSHTHSLTHCMHHNNRITVYKYIYIQLMRSESDFTYILYIIIIIYVYIL